MATAKAQKTFVKKIYFFFLSYYLSPVALNVEFNGGRGSDLFP